MPNYHPGDIVDVTIRSARVISDDGFNLVVTYQTTGGDTREVKVPSDGVGVSVEEVGRGDWPPQPGDRWVSGEPGSYHIYWSVRAHDHTHVCHEVGCDYTVELVDGDGQVYPIGNTVPAALRPIVLADRPAQVAA